MEGPIDLEDVVFALNNAQATGVAWLAHPSPVFVDAALCGGLSPEAVYDYPTADGDDAHEVHHAMDQPAVDAASPALTSEDVDGRHQMLEESCEFAGYAALVKPLSAAEIQAEIDELSRFLDTLESMETSV